MSFWELYFQVPYIHDGLWRFSWISGQENATILCGQNRIAKANMCRWNVDVHSTYILNSSNYNHTAPSVCSKYINIWNLFPTRMLDMSWTYWYHHHNIQLWARKFWRFKNPSFILYLGLSKGDFVYGPVGWSFMRRIPGIRGRFIPHRECQESGVNVKFWYSPLVLSMYKKNLNCWFGILYICNVCK